MTPLPIDPLLPEVLQAARGGALVLRAPPGAGKTTRVPRALLDLELPGEILVLQPRRLPTLLAARRVAAEMGQEPGGTVGYTVRFEDASSSRTRVRFVTEGILTRRLLAQPDLPGVSAVVLDEFHERHLSSDLALALLWRLKQTRRPELLLVVMSATLEAEPVAVYLDGAPVLVSEGRAFPVTIEHDERTEARPLHEKVAGAVKRLVREGLDGHVLCFLPGAAEIHRAREALAPFAADHDLELAMLHGDLPLEEQSRAVAASARRRVILSTNVAETSVTVEGVAAVVDTGLARRAGHSPWSGLPTLVLAPISRASAVQRAGRAGRTREGRALRLYPRLDFESRPAHDEPEVRRVDLAEALLALHGAGVTDPMAFDWFEPPAPGQVAAAEQLLTRLHALEGGRLTQVGKDLLRFPVHPRLGRIIVEGEKRGVSRDAAALAALASERDVRLEARAFGSRASLASGPSDLLDMLERLRGGSARSQGLDPRGASSASRAAAQLGRIARDAGAAPKDRDEALQACVLAGFPDRLARRRRPHSRELVFARGGSGELSESSVVHEAEFLVAVDAEERAGKVVVRLASAVDASWLLDLYPEELSESEEWSVAGDGRVMLRSRILFGQLALEESLRPAPPSETTSRALAEAALARGPSTFLPEGALDSLRSRLTVLAAAAPELGLASPTDADVETAVHAATAGLRSLSELREAGVLEQLLGALGSQGRAALAREVPERLTLPGGRSVEVHYEAGKEPWIESRLQDFFGMPQGPSVAKGRVPLTLHLLAPNGRAVQVTRDLSGFWERHYPAIRRELSRRYPRHPWPEDGRTATPPAPKGRR